MRKPFAITSRDAPMSAAIAAQREVWPMSVKATNNAFTARESVMFCRMVRRVRRECSISHGTFDRSSDMRATSAVSIAASLPTAPIAIPNVARAIAGASLTPSPIIATCP
jgi:hypothetical protein